MPPTSFSAPERWGSAGFGPSPIGYQFPHHFTQSIATKNVLSARLP